MEHLEDTIHRLRVLNGTLEMALMIAGDLLAERDPSRDSGDWYAHLIDRGTSALREVGVFPGRLSLFSDDELAVLGQLAPFGIGGDSEEGGALLADVRFECAHRGVPVAP